MLEATQTGRAMCACGFRWEMDGNEAGVFALSGTGVARGNSREWPTKDKAETVIASTAGIAGIAGIAVVGVEGMVQ